MVWNREDLHSNYKLMYSSSVIRDMASPPAIYHGSRVCPRCFRSYRPSGNWRAGDLVVDCYKATFFVWEKVLRRVLSRTGSSFSHATELDYGSRHLVTTTFEQPAPIEVASWPITLGIFWLVGIVPFYA